jgi:hypothetical protein
MSELKGKGTMNHSLVLVRHLCPTCYARFADDVGAGRLRG